ncbi:hypothetical protein [Candidatus Contendibacter odensensis]|uniref:Uncharacterized protein n=1 Tax=Candidatus Contendobacter odensis Run_B_J11 TaxID=1400861 RepID=A0A7U7GAR8_9GAMM|nr:hypothetical protein [Candidatus Contendobacter odensis]MBK8753830.1 hypothetical protein [Candidatus Competibacteraceae bacterium]CDH44818.1 hypothetical protein BN874_1910002 [Candidatus Contendobacter odensis Run_B_J11]
MNVQSDRTTSVKDFANGCLNAPRDKQPPLVIGSIEAAIAVHTDALGVPVTGKQVALDHDYTRHTLLHHGSPSERSRGQEPITDADLALARLILNQAKNIHSGTPPQSKNGCSRLEVIEEMGAYRYTVIYEVRRASVVVYTMFKRPK